MFIAEAATENQGRHSHGWWRRHTHPAKGSHATPVPGVRSQCRLPPLPGLRRSGSTEPGPSSPDRNGSLAPLLPQRSVAGTPSKNATVSVTFYKAWPGTRSRQAAACGLLVQTPDEDRGAAAVSSEMGSAALLRIFLAIAACLHRAFKTAERSSWDSLAYRSAAESKHTPLQQTPRPLLARPASCCLFSIRLRPLRTPRQ
jgi:hypothetical protein